MGTSGQTLPNRSALCAGMAVFVWILTTGIGLPRMVSAEPSGQGIENIRSENRIQDGRPDSLAAQGLVDPGQSVTVSATREFEIRDDRAYLGGHPTGMDQALLREPDGAAKKAKFTAWFKAVAPDIEVGICPEIDSGTGDSYPNMEVRIIQKEMPIPADGFVVNVETRRQDVYQNDGIFNHSARAYVIADCQRYLAAPNAAMLFHAAFIQGITNYSGSAPHPVHSTKKSWGG
ncbi:MAG: hypothetical protein JW829_10420 [Pirellulales bacterium]|nr:hypothetical protein [Pirellulales bacterium]